MLDATSWHAITTAVPYPGAGTRFVQIHHVEFQSDGGTHEISNLVSLCTAHHRLLHEGKLRIVGSVPDLVFHRISDENEPIELTDHDAHVGHDVTPAAEPDRIEHASWTPCHDSA